MYFLNFTVIPVARPLVSFVQPDPTVQGNRFQAPRIIRIVPTISRPIAIVQPQRRCSIVDVSVDKNDKNGKLNFLGSVLCIIVILINFLIDYFLNFTVSSVLKPTVSLVQPAPTVISNRFQAPQIHQKNSVASLTEAFKQLSLDRHNNQNDSSAQFVVPNHITGFHVTSLPASADKIEPNKQNGEYAS